MSIKDVTRLLEEVSSYMCLHPSTDSYCHSLS